MFSCRGIQLAVEWFLEKGHKDITVFVPAWRKEQSRPDALITGSRRFARQPLFEVALCSRGWRGRSHTRLYQFVVDVLHA